MTPAHYTNWMAFEARETERGLVISCRRTPRGAIALHAGIIAAGFGGFAWLTYTKAPSLFWATLAIGCVTLGGFLTQVILFHKSEQQRGPVLVYDREKATIQLPRQSRTFSGEEVDCICLVDGHAAEDPVCQLQLHPRTGDPLLLASAYRGCLDEIFDMVASRTPVVARRYNEGDKQ